MIQRPYHSLAWLLLPLAAGAQGLGDPGAGLGLLGLRVLLVLGLLGGVLWLLKRFRLAPGTLVPASTPLAVIAARGLGPRRQLVLVRVGRRLLVLGVSEAGIRTLQRLDEDESAEILGSGTPAEPGAPLPGFAGLLAALRNRGEGSR